ncbi:NADPH:quinone oxidoreductase family protein [Psychromarinibacter sp. S121]|uniref:NADPH:quinone oxidoreductase family protein n=1 Tax=Psychromarinibacter sp. S121 TaxID=3415127 RepID=UPI003C7BC788
MVKHYQISEYGGVPGFAEGESGQPAAGEVSIRIAACGLNFADLLTIEGTYQDRPEPPVTLGKEFSGTVEAAGEGCTLRPGTRVAVYSGQGGLAEAGCFPEARCLPIPDLMPFDVAAGFQVAYGTSHVALERAALKAGETLLVLGAAGGVGLTAVEIGRAMGATVIACARGADRLDAAREAGAHHLIDTETQDIRDTVKGLGRADVVYDPVGGDQFRAAFRAVKPGARMLAIGFASGDVPQIPANHLMVKNVSVIGVNWGGFLQFDPKTLADSLRTLIRWYEEGKLRPNIGHRLPFDQTPQALDLLRDRKAVGKIVVEIA